MPRGSLPYCSELEDRLMPENPQVFKAKVCMVGDAGVGKTSLVCRYVLDQFSDTYLSTLGTKVMKKQMSYNLPQDQKVDLMLTIWDIMGERELLGVVKESYFNGTKGIVAVCDLTREDTIAALATWLLAATRVVGVVPTIVAANKLDLIPPRSINRLSEELESFAKEHSTSSILTSAKTGENVEMAFRKLGMSVVGDIMRKKKQEESEAKPRA